MKKCKIMYVGIVFFILLLIFLNFLIRKFFIINYLKNRINSYNDIENVYYKVSNNSLGYTEFYKKGNIIKQITRKNDSQNSIISFTYEDRIVTYTITSDGKITHKTLENNYGVQLSLYPLKYINTDLNFFNTFLIAMNNKISSKNINDVDYYIISNKNETIYINKDTGLAEKRNDYINNIEVNYELKINTVTDNDIKED